MVEIWVPYGSVEVSFDVKQENLSQIVEPQPQKLTQEEIDAKVLELSGADSIFALSETSGAAKVLDAALVKNKSIRKILYPKHLESFAKKKAKEFLIPDLEKFEPQSLVDTQSDDSGPLKIPRQLKESSNLVILASVHLDPLFGLGGAASSVLSLNSELKGEALKRSVDELPCPIERSNASLFSTRMLQNCPNLSIVEVIERGSNVLNALTGEPEATHAKCIEYWKSSLSVSVPSRYERIVFGSGGGESDRSLTEALSRSFFNIAQNIALKDSDSKICMLAECSDGLGSEALLKYVTGSFTPGGSLDQLQYFEGLEVLLSLYRLKSNLELSIVSTLPSYYAARLDFKSLTAARDAPSSVVSQGSRAKILVVPDASTTYFKLPD